MCLLLYIYDISLLHYWISCNMRVYLFIISSLSFHAQNNQDQYHLESDGKIERDNQVIEDMLMMYVMDKPSK
jgi:hypothetical protein